MRYFSMKFIFSILCFLYSLHVAAQTASVTGTVVSSRGEAFPDAYVTLFNRSDDKLVKGTTTDEQGAFTLEDLPYGLYRLKVSSLGFRDKTIDTVLLDATTKMLSLGKIVLSLSENALKEVSVVKERNMLEMSIDKKTFNVDKNITAAGGTALDVLQNIPSVTADAAGNVSLRGKSSVTILIDGKPATLLAGDVASALQSMPSASIESIEVITNPSAKYDAQGSTGIINIITKVNRNQGINGSATLGISTRNKYNGGINLNMRKGKWNYALNTNFRISDNYQRTTTNRKNFGNDSGSYTYADYQRQFNGWFNSLTVGYTLDTQNTLSLTQNINVMRFGTDGIQEFRLFSAPGKTYSIQERDEIFKGGPNSASTNLNWKHKFKKPKQELTTELTFSFARSNNRQELQSDLFDGEKHLLYGTVLQAIPSTNRNRNFNGQADFTTPFLGKEGKLEAGAKSQNFWFNTSNDPTVTLPGAAPVGDALLKNQYEYEQHNHAGYASYSNKYHKWSYQAGLRLEYAGYSGVAGNVTTTSYSNSFLNLFPSAYLAYQLSTAQQLYLNYSRRTDRPFFLRMLPYLNVANALDTTSGNPDLKPEFIDNFECSYNLQLPKGNTLMASLYYQQTNNLIQNFTRTYADGTSFTLPVNINSASTYGAEVTAKTQITKAWDATISGNFFQNKINGGNIDASLNNEGFSWFSKLNTNYKLSGHFSFQLMGNYESAKPEAQGRRGEVYWVDLALKTNFLKNNKASIVINVSDIFNTRKYTTVYNLPLYSQDIYRDRETRIGTITFTYKFGKTEFGDKGDSGRGKRGKQNGSVQKKDIQERDGNLKSGDDDNNNGGGGSQK